LRSGLITLEQLSEVAMFARNLAEVRSRYPALNDRRLIHETIRRMINDLVTDLTQQSREQIRLHAPADIEQVRQAPPLVTFSPQVKAEQQELKGFLRQRLYQHYRVQRMANKARRIVRELFQAFLDDRRLLPPEFQVRAGDDAPRAIADYVAGMTDRYAIREHRRIFSVEE
jgi:dGTPase